MSPVHCKKIVNVGSTPRKLKGPSHTKHIPTVEGVMNPGEIDVTLKSVVNTINSCVNEKHVARLCLSFYVTIVLLAVFRVWHTVCVHKPSHYSKLVSTFVCHLI